MQQYRLNALCLVLEREVTVPCLFQKKHFFHQPFPLKIRKVFNLDNVTLYRETWLFVLPVCLTTTAKLEVILTSLMAFFLSHQHHRMSLVDDTPQSGKIKLLFMSCHF